MNVSIHQAKAHFPKLLKRALTGEEIIITKKGRPVAKLVPVSPEKRAFPLGIDKGKVWIAPDFNETPPEFSKGFYDSSLEP